MALADANLADPVADKPLKIKRARVQWEFFKIRELDSRAIHIHSS
jgi:hypothetical protein